MLRATFLLTSHFWPDSRLKAQQIKNKKNWDSRSKINLYSYWLKLSIICELQYNYHITAMPHKPRPCLSGPWDLILICHNRTIYQNRTCYTLYNKWALKSDWPIRNLKNFSSIYWPNFCVQSVVLQSIVLATILRFWFIDLKIARYTFILIRPTEVLLIKCALKRAFTVQMIYNRRTSK